jgi:hypothetical protein
MRAFYRGYHAATCRRAQQVRRLHVMREDGKFAGRQALCGAPGWGHINSPPIVLDPMPAAPLDGLTWCRACVGHATDLVGQLNAVARMISALAEPKTAPAEAEPAEAAPADRCGRCRQTRPLFTFSYVPSGWFEFVAIELCARCYGLSALEDEDDQLDQSVFAEQPVSSFAGGAR